MFLTIKLFQTIQFSISTQFNCQNISILSWGDTGRVQWEKRKTEHR